MSNTRGSNRAERRSRVKIAAATAKVRAKKPAKKKASARSKATSAGNGGRTLVAARLPRAQLTETGAQFNVAKLIAHIHTIIGLIEANNADENASIRFGDISLDETYVIALKVQIAKVDALREQAGAAADSAMPAARALRKTTDKAAGVRSTLLIAVGPNPLRDKKLRSGRGDTRPGLRIALADLPKAIPSFAKTTLGGPAEMKQAAKDAVKNMDDAERAYKLALAKLSPPGRSVRAEMGVLYEEGKSVADIARRIDPNNSHLYAMKVHLRTRKPSLRKRRSSSDMSNASGPGANTPAKGGSSAES